jgi:hypothetical protein
MQNGQGVGETVGDLAANASPGQLAGPKPVSLYELGIDIDVSDVIDDYGDPMTMVDQYLDQSYQEGSFSAS